MKKILALFFSETSVADSYEQYGTLKEEKKPTITEKAVASMQESVNRLLGFFKIGSR